VNWVTIYDVRSGWTLWIAGTLTILLVSFELFLSFGWVRMFRMAPDVSQKRKNIFAATVFFAVLGPLTALTLWFAISDYVLRADLNGGRFMETEGPINDAHIESSGRSNSMYFRIGERWFKLPFHYSPECFPQDGEPANVVFEPSADLKHSGPPAHTVLKMQLLHGCKLPMWG